MSNANAGAVIEEDRREDFPVDTFRYLEAKLQEIRKGIMNRAAEIAAALDQNPRQYRVDKGHIDQALSEFLCEVNTSHERLGLTRSA